MASPLMVWWVEPTIRYRMQIVLCASAKFALNNGISNRLTNILEVSGIQGVGQL